jgi:flagellar hook-associated protein 1 FlgK
LVSRFQGSGIVGADGRGLFTDAGNAIAPGATSGLAGRIAVNERVDPAQGGEVWRIRDGLDAATPGPVAATGHVSAMLDAMTASQAASGSLSRPDTATGLAATLGAVFEQRSQSLEDRAATSQGRLQSLEQAESAVIGVDIDRELQHLILIEQAYAANARVIEVADRLVQRLLEI